MSTSHQPPVRTFPRDLLAGAIVFLVAVPLCLGIALASGAPLFAGIVSGVVGGVVVGTLSGSHTSVSGPAAGLTAIVAAQITLLKSYDTFLLAVVVAGLFQIGLGLIKAGSLSAFFPSSVIKGLLAAIGLLLIIKQLPYLLGHDVSQVNTMSSGEAPGPSSVLSEAATIFTGEIHAGALTIGLVSLAVLLVWERWKRLKKSLIPAPLVVVLLGMLLAFVFRRYELAWELRDHSRFMVNVPVAESIMGFFSFLTLPDFTQWRNPAIYVSALTLATVASLETLLNLDAVDKLDRKQRYSPPNRELFAQGVGNITCGMLGGIPITSVIIRGSVNINAGSETKLAAILHGVLLLACVMLMPTWLNAIPLSSLAAILLMTGFKLASPSLVRSMWREGRSQFLPFVITLVVIVATDLLIGIGVGLAVSFLFILYGNLTVPIRQVIEKHVGGEVRHIELGDQLSFLNKAALEQVLRAAPRGSHVLIDARRTEHVDPDVLSLIREFKKIIAPAHQVQVSLFGFKHHHKLSDDIQFVDYTTRELQAQLTPSRVLSILIDGNKRFRSGQRLDRDLRGTSLDHSSKQHPMAIIFSGIDPRTPAEIVFDLGLGDVYNIRMAGNVVGPSVLGGMEYACAIGGAKLILILGHTQSGLIRLAIDRVDDQSLTTPWGPCTHLKLIVDQLSESIEVATDGSELSGPGLERTARAHVIRGVKRVVEQSPIIRTLVTEGRVAVVGAIFDVSTGEVEFLLDEAIGDLGVHQAGVAMPTASGVRGE